MSDKIEQFMKKLREMPDFNRVKFVILFGSYAENRQNNLSDIDFAVYYNGNAKERFNFRKKMLGFTQNNFDIQVFQDLPLYVRKEVLRGKLVYYSDLTFAYDIAYETIRAFEDFKRKYYDYINIEKIK